MWMILAGAGTCIRLGFSFISRKHFAPGTVVDNPIEFIVLSIVLIALIPFAVKDSHQLGLPGGPLITSKLNGKPQPYGWGEVLIAGVLWSVIALVVLMIALVVSFSLLAYFSHSLVPHLPYPIQQPHFVKPSEIWLATYVLTSALSAGVQEEILFRFVLMALFTRALITISGNVDQPPGSGQLWLVNIIQAYFFGLAHLIPDFHRRSGIVGLLKLAIRPLVQPQTLTGVFFGWLYLRHGLETSMVSHIFFDLLALIGVSAAIR